MATVQRNGTTEWRNGNGRTATEWWKQAFILSILRGKAETPHIILDTIPPGFSQASPPSSSLCLHRHKLLLLITIIYRVGQKNGATLLYTVHCMTDIEITRLQCLQHVDGDYGQYF